MTDRLQQDLERLSTTLYLQEQEYIRRLSQNRQEDEKFPRNFSASYLEAEKRTLQDALRNTNAARMQLVAIIKEAESD